MTHAAAADAGGPSNRRPNSAVRAAARGLLDPRHNAAERVKAIEARTNHDVKAVEYYVRECLAAAGATPAVLELVHFGCTSEDINNLAYAGLLQKRPCRAGGRKGIEPVLADAA